MAGTFYGVSVGCGDPELLTMKAVKALEKCQIIAVPRTKGEQCLALSIARQAVEISKKQILYIDFPMSRDPEILDKNYSEAAGIIAEKLEKNSVAMVCLGDISVYSTFSYIAEKVKRLGFKVSNIPGITSFCGASAAIEIPLVSGSESLHIIPFQRENIRKNLLLPGTKVIMKCGKNTPELIEILQETDLIRNTFAVENCGLPEEKVFHGSEIPMNMGYFTVFIIKTSPNELCELLP